MKRKTGAVRRFAAGLCLTLGAILLAVLLPALNEGLFARVLIAGVDAGLQADEAQLRGFASETIGYIDGRVDRWSPQVVARDGVILISQDFAAHMAEVRQGVAVGKLACGACWLIGLALMGWEWARRRSAGATLSGGRSCAQAHATSSTTGATNGGACAFGTGAGQAHLPRLASPAYYLGAALPLALTLALCLWAALDFAGFWGWLHRVFIPGGIFAANEPVMRLFPLGLFGAYLAPVAAALVIGLGAVIALPLVLERVGRKDRKPS